MKNTFMYDLYFGKLAPFARKCPQSPAFTATSQKIRNLDRYFQETLSPEAYQKFEELEDLYAQSDSMEETDLFSYGFRLGALMMMDVYACLETQRSDTDDE